ncbi:DUF418 domain-containing protein [Micromonospora sp. NPDC051925]|uniref:DUF418 domain-containing protein n=1 Tax=Micromonospora sp. NPDC051925 TaxID=3364288 RepID=UPI0037C8ABEC
MQPAPQHLPQQGLLPGGLDFHGRCGRVGPFDITECAAEAVTGWLGIGHPIRTIGASRSAVGSIRTPVGVGRPASGTYRPLKVSPAHDIDVGLAARNPSERVSILPFPCRSSPAGTTRWEQAVFFTGVGLRLAGTVGPPAVLLIAIGIYAAQVVASAAWLTRFPSGPVEWLLRRWTVDAGGARSNDSRRSNTHG